MIRTILRFLSITVALLLPFGCSGDHGEPQVHRRALALLTPGQTPVPCTAPGKFSWHGSAAELLVADAWAACGRNPDGTSYTPLDHSGGEGDDYLTGVFTQMKTTTLSAQGVLKAWIDLRKEPLQNCDPVTGLQNTAGVSLDDDPPVQEWIDLPPTEPNDQYERAAYANADLRSAGVNDCIAQRLRAAFPGAAGASALFLSEAEQRELMQVIRDRAQLAVLQYATLAVLFATPYVGNPPSGTCEQRIPLLQGWALVSIVPGQVGEDRTARLTAMGKDFAGALQLLVTVTSEFADLLMRSRSKRAPTGLVSASRAEESWGHGSWYQRILALLYGGDPLADATGALQPNAAESPGDEHVTDIPSEWIGKRPAEDWPAAPWMPFVSTSLAQPEVKTLLDLARQYDMLLFDNDQSPTACSRLSTTDAAAEKFYERVEHELRKSECVGFACHSLPPPQAPFPQEKYLLWEKHGVRPEHARALVEYFAQSFNDTLGREQCISSYGFTTAQELQSEPPMPGVSYVYPYVGVRPGAQNVKGAVQVSPEKTRFSSDAQFVQRTVGELASEFTRFGAWRVPAPWEVRPFTASEFWGLPDPCGVFLDNNENRRRMGVTAIACRAAVSALMIRSSTSTCSRGSTSSPEGTTT